MTSSPETPDTPRTLYAAGLIYLAVVAYVLLRWEAIPDPIPTHIGPKGVDAWADKTFFAATALVWIGAVISVGISLAFPSPHVARATQPVPETSPIPFSATTAARVEQLCRKGQRLLAELMLGLAALLAVIQIRLDFPDAPISDWSIGVLIIAFTVYVPADSVRMMRKKGSPEPDAEESQRLEHLKHKAGMGVYNEPNDPMAAFVHPAEPGKIQLNHAHPAGKRQLRRMGVGIALSVAAPILIAVML